MELHGGALTLESETGVGTVATVTIPVDRMIL
jgi:signal transduction histidine kinase